MLKYTAVRLVGGISGILLSLFIVRLLMKCKVVVPLFSMIGSKTLPIYALHVQFDCLLPMFGFKCSAWSVPLLSVVLLGVSVACYEVLRRNRYLAFFLFGEWKASRNKECK